MNGAILSTLGSSNHTWQLAITLLRDVILYVNQEFEHKQFIVMNFDAFNCTSIFQIKERQNTRHNTFEIEYFHPCCQDGSKPHCFEL